MTDREHDSAEDDVLAEPTRRARERADARAAEQFDTIKLEDVSAHVQAVGELPVIGESAIPQATFPDSGHELFDALVDALPHLTGCSRPMAATTLLGAIAAAGHLAYEVEGSRGALPTTIFSVCAAPPGAGKNSVHKWALREHTRRNIELGKNHAEALDSHKAAAEAWRQADKEERGTEPKGPPQLPPLVTLKEAKSQEGLVSPLGQVEARRHHPRQPRSERLSFRAGRCGETIKAVGSAP